MVIYDFSGDFLKFESTNDGDICEILNEGEMEFNSVLNKNMFNIKVRKGDKVMKWSPNNEAGKILQQSFGMDSKDWVGNKFEIIHVQKNMKIRPIKVEKVSP